LWIVGSQSGAEPQKLLEDPDADLDPNDWTVTGYLLVQRDNRENADLFTYSVAEGERKPWATTEFMERAASASPDGHFAAYVSDETGQAEVWVQALPNPTTRWRASVDGGDWPAWHEDGGELYYVDRGGHLVALPVTWRESEQGRTPEFGQPEVLFREEFKGHEDRQFDTIDGKTFLLNRVLRRGERDPMTLLQNW
jgi:Tol biopolymer transport system component